MVAEEFSAGGIVMRYDGERPGVLLIKDSYGRWTWPKGKIENGERPEDAAVREIGEETGLKNIELISPLGNIQYFYRLKGRLIFKTVYLFLFRHNGTGNLEILQREIQDGAWFEPEEALRKVEYKGAKDFLKKGIRRFAEV